MEKAVSKAPQRAPLPSFKLIVYMSRLLMISETNLKLLIPCSKCMHRPMTCMHQPVMSQANACMYCMQCPMMSQANACNFCMGSIVLISSQIYLYLLLLCC